MSVKTTGSTSVAPAVSFFRTLGEEALQWVLPTTCVGCGAWAQRWCGHCEQVGVCSLYPSEQMCQLYGGEPVWAAAAYAPPWNAVAMAYKERNRRDAYPLLAMLLARSVAELLRTAGVSGAVLVPVPSSPHSRRRRGGWPWAEVTSRAAGELSRWLPHGCTVQPVARWGDHHVSQRGLNRHQRGANVGGRAHVVRSLRVPFGVGVIVVDDVVSTGASALAVVHALRRHQVAVAGVATALRNE